jgi:hypothetical protein
VSEGLEGTDWLTRRAIIRALVKKVEVDENEARIVYRVSPSPFEDSPQQGLLQHCWGRRRVFRTRWRRKTPREPGLGLAPKACLAVIDGWRLGRVPASMVSAHPGPGLIAKRSNARILIAELARPAGAF